MVLSPLFLAAGAVATSVLNAMGRFGASAIAPLVYNLAIIGAAVLLAPSMGVGGPRRSASSRARSATCSCSSPALRRLGVRIRPSDRPARPRGADGARAAGRRAPSGSASVQLVFVVATGIAASLQTGAITAFNFAFTLLQIPIGVIGVPLGIVLLPSLARHVAVGEEETFRRMLIRALRLLAFVMVPIAGLGMVVAADVVRMLFGAVRRCRSSTSPRRRWSCSSRGSPGMR